MWSSKITVSRTNINTFKGLWWIWSGCQPQVWTRSWANEGRVKAVPCCDWSLGDSGVRMLVSAVRGSVCCQPSHKSHILTWQGCHPARENHIQSSSIRRGYSCQTQRTWLQWTSAVQNCHKHRPWSTPGSASWRWWCRSRCRRFWKTSGDCCCSSPSRVRPDTRLPWIWAQAPRHHCPWWQAPPHCPPSPPPPRPPCHNPRCHHQHYWITLTQSVLSDPILLMETPGSILRGNRQLRGARKIT